MEDVRSLIKVLKEELGEQTAVDLLPHVLTITAHADLSPAENPFEGVLTNKGIAPSILEAPTARYTLRNSGFHPVSKDSAFRAFLGEMGYTHSQLAVMQDLIDNVPLLVMAAQHKGVRFDVSDVEDLQAIVSFEDDVVIFRGTLGKFVHKLCEHFKAGIAR